MKSKAKGKAKLSKIRSTGNTIPKTKATVVKQRSR